MTIEQIVFETKYHELIVQDVYIWSIGGQNLVLQQ